MEETVIVIMIKDERTGFLEKELFNCAVKEHDELLLNVFAINKGSDCFVVLKLTCEGDVSDKDFDAVYDYYDEAVYEGLGVSFKEVEDCYNPTWELSFKYDEQVVEEKINLLLDIHAKELSEVFEAIKSGN